MIQLTLILKMTTAQVVETSVTVNNNSPIQDYVHPDDQTQPTFEVTPGFKPFIIEYLIVLLETECDQSYPFFAFQFSDLLDLEESPKGTRSHANKVMERARKLFGTLGARNTFKPKVLALVSHNNSWFVGASVAVSPYVRPLVLYTRINDFNWSLKKSVIYSKALQIESNGKWSSSAFFKNKNYKEKKDPCPNCEKIFGKLDGFLPENVKQEEDGANACASNESSTFLAACAEYIPVNLLLHERDSSPDEKVENVLEKFHCKCLRLITNFKNIADECSKAFKKRDSVQLREIYEKRVKETVHIFGVKPECNGSLLALASTC